MQPTYSRRILRPFFQVLSCEGARNDNQPPQNTLSELEERVPIVVAHRMLESALRHSQDPLLGLKAARAIALGDCGALDYMLQSATNVRSACELATRYARLVNDTLDCRLEIRSDRALFRIESHLPMPRQVEDFLIAGMYRTHVQEWARECPELECWFMHEQPADSQEYASILGGARCRFSAPFSAFVFPTSYLEVPMAHADPKLNGVIRDLVDNKLAEMPQQPAFTQRLRVVLEREVLSGLLNGERIARMMRVSRRTLARRLEAEGTAFYEQVDSVRKATALSYVAASDVPFAELAKSLGFAHVASFYRAFKRWTGQTPADYRRRASSEHGMHDA